MSQSSVEQQKRTAAASAAAQQSDNIAHALAGAGGGILSMVLTCAKSQPHSMLHFIRYIDCCALAVTL